MEILEKLFKRHKDWCNIVESFGCNPDTAEDVVQEMYLKIGKLVAKGKDISFGDDVNHFYIFRTLTTLFLDHKRKDNRSGEVLEDIEAEQDEEVDYSVKYQKILDALEELYWYDRKVFEIVENGESISELSRKTNISYYSLYNTYKKVKKYLKSKL
jgi:RNA polymerase sigma factor (sigma-70 family)